MEDYVGDDGRNQHGFPRGYHFVPRELELLRLLDDKLAGRPLPHPLPNIFHDLRIRDFHPAELYEEYKEHEEAGYIYFFSEREFATLGGRKKRPARATKCGGWKASGGGKAVRTMRNGVGVDVGQKLTMVFYQRKFERDKDPDKTDWGMHEFTRIVGPDNKLADMAVYRLYKMRSGKENKKADRRAATSSGAAKAPPAALTVAALPSPRQMATGTSFVASTSQAGAQASVGQPHHGYAFGTTALAPGPTGWVMPAAANPTVQLQGAGHARYMGLTGLPGLAMASGPATAANYPPASQQQQATDHFEYAGLAEWHKMLQMVPPPPPPLPPPAPPTASGPATAVHDLPTSQQQAAEHVGYPAHAGWNEQLLKMDLPPPLLKMDLPPPLPAPAPAPAAEGYMSDEFNKWLHEVSTPAADPWFSMPGDDLPMLTDDEHQQCTFTFDELLGDMDDETVAASDTYRWLSGPG